MSEHARRQEAEREAQRVVWQEWAPYGCLVCDETDQRVLQAHHVDPNEKDCTVGQLRWSLRTRPEVYMAELAKCVPLCSNHHDILHAMWNNGHAQKGTMEIVAILREEWEATHSTTREDVAGLLRMWNTGYVAAYDEMGLDGAAKLRERVDALFRDDVEVWDVIPKS